MPESASAAAATRLSPRRRLVFTGLMLLIPVLFFVLLEGGLRLAGYGDDYPLFEPVPGNPEYLVQNREVARRYFAHQREVPNSLRDYFLREKRDDEVRIFVQGGSSAAGYPFYRGGSFSRMLEQRLQQTFPDRHVEVINTAMAAVNTYTLLDLASEIIEQEPDAVLVYAGHNEYYGALGVGSTESLGSFRGLITLYLKLRRLRTVQLLRDGLSHLAGLFASDAGGRGSTLMAQMVGEQTIPYGSAAYERGLRQFRSNLSDLLATYERAGVPVFVATLASNERDLRPFVTVHAPGVDEAAWQEQVEAGVEALQRGDAAAAVHALEAAVAMDSLAADGYFVLGRAYEQVGDTMAAQRAYRAARDRDALRFRAPSAFNEIIRQEAAAHGATVVEVEEAFRQRAPGRVLGHEHFLEHLHPTLEGYFLIADAFYDTLQQRRLIGDGGDVVPEEVARAERLVTTIDSLGGVLRVRQLMAEWPFQPLGTRGTPEPFALRSVEDSLAWAVYTGASTWIEAVDRLAVHYAAEGDVRRALQARFAIIQDYPLLASAYLATANLLLRIGRSAEAAQYYEATLERDPDVAEALKMLGAIHLQRREVTRATEYLERSRRINPRDPQTLYNLSGAYALSSRFAEARETAEALLRLQPDHAAGRQLLASLPPSR